MKEIRSIRKKMKGQNTTDGAGVKLVRTFGFHDTQDFDPFLLFDAFDSTNPSDYVKGFPWHPHRGIETITYLIEGIIEHGDSMGNTDHILAGDCQWMTAGSGIVHQEMPKPSKRLLGAQLWLNLPASNKMTKPKYRPILKKDIPVVADANSKVHVICGNFNNQKGAIQSDFVETLYLDVELVENSEWILETKPDHTLFIYIVQGEAEFADVASNVIDEKHIILFSEGKKFIVKTKEKKIRFLLISGKPLKEPIAWGGPIVMNTRAELDKAFEELDNNTFLKK